MPTVLLRKEFANYATVRFRHFRGPLPRIIQCDGYIVYRFWAKDTAWIKLMGCRSHMRLKFFEATEQLPRLVGWILRQIAHLYHIKKRLRETNADPALPESVRTSESSMVHRRLKKASDKLALRRAILPKSKPCKAISYAIRQWTNLEVYLGVGRAEICNNLVENFRRLSIRQGIPHRRTHPPARPAGRRRHH